MTRLTACLDAEAVAVRAAEVIARELDRARGQRGAAHIALSGGTTPARTFELLGAGGGDFSDVQWWFADERCVAPDDEESNYRLAAETLLRPAGIADDSVHRMRGELGPSEGAREYAAQLGERVPAARDGAIPSAGGASGAGGAGPAAAVTQGAERATAAGALPVLDLVVLGIGPDGHVASLFPGADTLKAPPSELCLGVVDSPKPPPERITLSLAVLRAARGCVLLATGSGKADAVSAMLSDPTPSVPASLLRRERLSVIVDDAAAPPGPPHA